MAVTLELKTASGKKSKKDKPDRLTIESPMTKVVVAGKKKPVNKPLVDVAIELKQQAENIDAELKNAKKKLIEESTTKRQESLDAKTFVKTVDIQGTNAKIQVQFQDRYSPLAAEMEAPLREIFDGKFDTMFDVNEHKQLKEGKQQEIIELIGKDKYEAMFETIKTVTPVKDFQYHYFVMEDSLNADQKETVQKVFEGTQSTPAVKFPK